MQFKIGDKVICQSMSYVSLTFGRVYTIKSVGVRGHIYLVNDYGQTQRFKPDKFKIKPIETGFDNSASGLERAS